MAPVVIKSGWCSSELYVTLITSVLSFLAITGVITPQDSSMLQEPAVNAITNVFPAITNMVVIWTYISGRTAIKQTVATAVLEQPVVVKIEENTTKQTKG